MLLSYHSSSVVQHIPNGEEIDMEDVGEQYGFDTASRTLAATKDPEICQVTETSISIIGPSQRYGAPLRCSCSLSNMHSTGHGSLWNIFLA